MNIEEFRKDLDAFIEPIIERRNELKKEIDVAENYNANRYIINQAKLELKFYPRLLKVLCRYWLN